MNFSVKAPLFFHRVQEGQTLNDIAGKFNVDANVLLANNPEVTEATDASGSFNVPILSTSIVVINLSNSSVT